MQRIKRQAILTNQFTIMTALKIPNAPPPPPALIRYRYWNAKDVDCNMEVPEDEDLMSASDDSQDDAADGSE